FPQMYRLFPSDRAAHGDRVRELVRGEPLRPRWDDPGTTIEDYMRTYHVAGVLVLQDGKVRLERYADNHGPAQYWTSFSVAKSVTSTLLGIALQEGHVRSLDDRLAGYIPE